MVGVNAVGTENIKDNSVTIQKLSFTIEDLLGKYLATDNESWEV